MSLRRSIAVPLATVALTLGAAAPASAVPALDAGAPRAAAPVILLSAGPSTGDDGVGTTVVVLLAAGALLAGAAAGFGGAKASAGRTPLHPH